jgi:hypothetical protein
MKLWVFTLLITVFSATSAYTECAWVLWGKETKRKKYEGIEGINPSAYWSELWVIEEAFPKAADCNTALAPRLRQWTQIMAGSGEYEVSLLQGGQKALAAKREKLGGSSSGSSPSSPVESSLRKTFENAVQETSIAMEYKCLPDTVDPRAKDR